MNLRARWANCAGPTRDPGAADEEGETTMALSMLAYDFGASSGRAMLGRWNGRTLALEELHRFSNDPLQMHDQLVWDAPGLYREVLTGLAKAASSGGAASVGIDTWGVDFGLIDGRGRLMGNPVHYRDARTDRMMEEAFKTVPKQEIFARTGLAFMQFNTLYQLLAMKAEGDEALARAKALLFMPDLFAYLLTGEVAAEYTIASTSQLINPRTRQWHEGLLADFGLPGDILPAIMQPGTVRGPLREAIARDAGLLPIPVMNVGSHDTASAVAAVPAQGGPVAYISSGTWSLMGTEIDAPITSPEALAANITNEGGVGGKIRLLKNVMGLWIIQECRRAWQKDGYGGDFADIVALAAEAPQLTAFIDPDEGRFLYPGDMPQKVADFCRETGQRPPEGIGATARVIFESLALKYRWTLGHLQTTTGQTFPAIHVVGGGSKNNLLNQLSADCAGVPVYAGPSEATAIGNLLLQAVALGELSGLAQARQAVAASFSPDVFEPRDTARFDGPYALFCEKIVRA